MVICFVWIHLVFVFPFAKKLIIRNKSRDFQMQCNLDEKGFEMCLVRVFLFFSKVKSNSTLLPYGYNSLKLQEIEVMILCLMIVCLKSNIPRLSQFSFYWNIPFFQNALIKFSHFFFFQSAVISKIECHAINLLFRHSCTVINWRNLK